MPPTDNRSTSKAHGDYQKCAEQLVAQGDAYYAFDTPEDLAALPPTIWTKAKNFNQMPQPDSCQTLKTRSPYRPKMLPTAYRATNLPLYIKNARTRTSSGLPT